MRELETLLDVKHKYTTSYYPRCSGLVESFNGTCQKILFNLVDVHPKDWDEYKARLCGLVGWRRKAARDFHPMNWFMVRKLCYFLR